MSYFGRVLSYGTTQGPLTVHGGNVWIIPFDSLSYFFNIFNVVPVLILFGNISRETHAGDMFDVFLTEMAEYSQ